MLVSKLLQNISNGVTGTSKERFMVLMNDFVQSSSLKLTQFFANISVLDESNAAPPRKLTHSVPAI